MDCRRKPTTFNKNIKKSIFTKYSFQVFEGSLIDWKQKLENNNILNESNIFSFVTTIFWRKIMQRTIYSHSCLSFQQVVCMETLQSKCLNFVCIDSPIHSSDVNGITALTLTAAQGSFFLLNSVGSNTL